MPRAFGICTMTGLRVRFDLRGPLFNLSLLAREIASYTSTRTPFGCGIPVCRRHCLQCTLSGPGRRAKPLNLQANAAHTGGARLALLVPILDAGSTSATAVPPARCSPSPSHVGAADRRHRHRDHLHQARRLRCERRCERRAAVGGVGPSRRTPLAGEHHGNEHVEPLHGAAVLWVLGERACVRACVRVRASACV